MGCDLTSIISPCQQPSFNPRTHMGCDLGLLWSSVLRLRFQSTHPHGVRPMIEFCLLNLLKFQSTHPHGVRRERRRCLQEGDGVSIHAPTWGATPFSVIVVIRQYCFNPRTHMGCDAWCLALDVYQDRFQSTHPHGVRQSGYEVVREDHCFNPRTHMGCDRADR